MPTSAIFPAPIQHPALISLLSLTANLCDPATFVDSMTVAPDRVYDADIANLSASAIETLEVVRTRYGAKANGNIPKVGESITSADVDLLFAVAIALFNSGDFTTVNSITDDIFAECLAVRVPTVGCTGLQLIMYIAATVDGATNDISNDYPGFYGVDQIDNFPLALWNLPTSATDATINALASAYEFGVIVPATADDTRAISEYLQTVEPTDAPDPYYGTTGDS